MCIIAGYTGNKNAAPILIEMLGKTEYIDGGLSTGIATIHEGKLYVRKVLGDVSTLLRETDALSLPGTTGIIHSRTANNYITHAHPQVSFDGKLAAVDNGTMVQTLTPEFIEESNSIMAKLIESGVEVKSEVAPFDYKRLPNGNGYHETELWALYIGEAVKNLVGDELKVGLANATRDIISRLPADIITLNIHADMPGVITIGNITRPMSCGFGDGEIYLATVPMAFPDDVQSRPIMHLPMTSVSRVSPSGLEILSTSLPTVKVEEIDYRVAARIRTDMERLLKGKKDSPLSIYDLPFLTDWREVWLKDDVECVYKKEGGLLKPFARIMYEGLWSFHKEGRLHSVLGEKNGKTYLKFWID